MNKKFYIILILSLSTILHDALDASPVPISACYEHYISLLKDKDIENNKKISKWKTFKSTCSSEDEYDLYLAHLYIFYSKKDTEKSKEIFKKIIYKSKDEFLVQQSEKMLMGMVLEKKQYEILKEKALRVVKKYPQWYCGYVFLGISAIYSDKNHSKAKRYCDKSIALEETAEGRCWQAYIEYLLKNYRRSLSLYERAMELDMVVLLAVQPTIAAAHSAMILDKWSSARWILNAQKSANRDIENCSSDYQELRKMLEQHDAEQESINKEADND